MSKNTVYKIVAILLFILIVGVSLFVNEQLLGIPKGLFAYSKLAVALVIINVISLIAAVITIQSLSSKEVVSTSSLKNEVITKESKTKASTEDKITSKTVEQDIDVSEAVSRLFSSVSTITEIEKFAETALMKISKEYPIVQGLFFVKERSSEWYILRGKYAFYSEREVDKFQLGEGLSGQVAKDQKVMNISNVPKDYITILSGLGKGSPQYLFLLPIVENEETIALIELASFSPITPVMEKTFIGLGEKFCTVLSKIR